MFVVVRPFWMWQVVSCAHPGSRYTQRGHAGAVHGLQYRQQSIARKLHVFTHTWGVLLAARPTVSGAFASSFCCVVLPVPAAEGNMFQRIISMHMCER
jgi:hypothetical protein